MAESADMGASRARDEIAKVLDRSRLDELDELDRAHHARAGSLVLGWLAGWLRGPRAAVAEPLPDVAGGEVGLSFAGHATLVVRYAKLAIACDPMLAGRLGWQRRAVRPGHSAAEMEDVGLILVSNDDDDHLHLPTLRRLPRAATVVVPPRCAGLVSGLGFARVVELGIGQSFQHRGVDVFSTPVRHARGQKLRRGRGACAYVVRGDGPSVFFCGASGYFSGFAEVGRRYRPDIAALPIGGFRPRSWRHDYMSPLDALYAFEDLGARLLVPIRYGAFRLSLEHVDEPADWLARLVAQRQLEPYVAVVPAGGSRKFTHPTSGS